MSTNGIEPILREHAFFKDMAEEQLSVIAGCASHVAFDKDEVIFRQNEDAEKFYIIQDGRVTVDIVTTAQILPGSANLFGGRAVTVRMTPWARSVADAVFPDAPNGF